MKCAVSKALDLVVGVDAGKWRHRVYVAGELVTVENKTKELKRFLKGLGQGAVIGVESTARYHLLLADLAAEMGLTVYVLNARRTASFKRASGLRGKSDNIDARFIAKYVSLFHESLHPYVPYPARLGRLRWLAKRRIEVASRKHDLQMSLRGQLKAWEQLAQAFDRILQEIDSEMEAIAKEYDSYKRLLRLPGVGPVIAAGLVAVLEHIPFRGPDSFVAYCGLDPRPWESGKKVGKRRLTKFGDSSLRRLLFLGAMTGQKCLAWKSYYQAGIERGLTKMTGLLRIARRLARLAYFTVRQNLSFDQATFCSTLDNVS